MKLYHGTTAAKLGDILEKGIQPRGDRPGNWEEFPSRDDLVYLTNSYALYFAMSATVGKEDFLLLEVEVDEDRLLPDEDFLEQATRGKRYELGFADNVGIDDDMSMEEATLAFRDELETFQYLAQESLQRLGNASHMGTIQPHQIKRWATISDPSFVFMFDPTITLMNYGIMGPFYRNGMKWFFDPEVEFEEDILAGDSNRIKSMSRKSIKVCPTAHF